MGIGKVSFEMLMENKQLRFIIVCDEYFKSIIEKQVTSFYPSANIEYLDDYEFHTEGNKMNGFYMHTINEYFLSPQNLQGNGRRSIERHGECFFLSL